jgi:flagellar protein FlaJ
MIPPVLAVFLVVGLLLLGLLVASAVSDRIDRTLTRLALAAFREAVETQGRYGERRKGHLQSIHATMTYPVYASKTLLFSVIAGIGGSLVAVFGLWFVLTVLTSVNETLRSALPENLAFLVPAGDALGGLPALRIFVMLLASSATVGMLAGGLTYYGRWWHVRSRANRREVLVDESVARTIAFIYALSRSGMVYPEIMRTVGDNRNAFGESAEEIGVVVKDMDLFGADLVTALERIAQRTPSEQFSDFAENFANVLRTGRNVSDYLREQYDQYQEERVSNQERLLELFTALGEGYVAALVAGPLFLLTILLVFGILTGGLLDFLRGMVYVLIPLANVGFVFYLDSISESLTTYRVPVTRDIPSRKLNVRRAEAVGEAGRTDGGVPAGGDRSERADGGVRAGLEREMNEIRLAAYTRFETLRKTVIEPVETMVAKPTTILYVTVPFLLAVTAVRLRPVVAGGTIEPRAVDDILIQSTLVLVATFAVVQELHTRRLKRIEEAIPDLLDRLASTNEAGMTFTDALKQIDRSDLGALDEEVSKLLADVEWGARTEKALLRFGARLQSSTISRIVALVTNAMNASGNVGPVIRIAADEAREDRRLKQTRRQEMFMYVLIIYISFVVFLGIGLALQQILIPAIPTGEELGGIGGGIGGAGGGAAGGAAPGIGGGADLPIDPIGPEEQDKYTLVLYHAAMVQAVCSGLVAGKMGSGSIRDGAKHVAVMLGIAYAVFLVVAG